MGPSEIPSGATPDAFLDQALAFQADRASRGLPHEFDMVLDRFPVLRGNADAELAVLYNHYRLTPSDDQAAKQRQLVEQFPHHAESLNRQISFGQIVDSCLGDEQASWTGADTIVESDAGHARQRQLSTPLKSLDQIGRFQIERLIGHGGMSSVYLALDTVIDREVAIKIPRPRKNGVQAFDERCFQEAKIAAKCEHPGLVDILEVGRWQEYFFLVTRFANRGDLATWMQEHPGPQPVAHVVELMHAVAEAVGHCHSLGVMHLDLKPANLLFTTDEHDPSSSGFFPGKIQVADFGLARLLDLDVSQTSTNLFGTLLYMSPEQIDGGRNQLSPTIDVFALGVILYQLLTGRHPFESTSTIVLMQRIHRGEHRGFEKGSDIPLDLQTICKTCLAIEPESRYRDARELAADLKRFQNREPIAGLPEPIYKKVRRWCRQEVRIEQAAMISAFGHGSIIIGFIAAVAIFACFEFSFPVSVPEIAIDSLKLTLFPHLPAMLISAAVLRGRWTWQWANVLIGLCTFGMVLITFISGESPVRRYAGEPFAFVTAHLLVLGIAFVTLLPQLASIPALIQLRKREAANGEAVNRSVSDSDTAPA
ncbi:serine/threonine-protein kinase [Roseiconus lacunae]|uniref:serine/threonine-protein kinase n=1 Tax=Roseiconus lacunae TaxID=2605694 RepID=UPI001E43AF6D|nr:serine/threonine-protein kinase [Roseiconus lacunae]MCD0460250.1 serine/threonine protein kinase [Roseiconus lacunae]